MFMNHCHVYPKGLLSKDNPEFGTVEKLIEIIERLSFEKAVVFPGSLFDVPEGHNQWMHDAVEKYSNLVRFLMLDPKKEDAVEKLDSFAQKGFKGVKFHPASSQTRINDPAIDTFYSKAEELGFPLIMHTGVHRWQLSFYRPILIDEVARRHPFLRIVVEHMGGVEFFYEALAVVRNNPNCYAGITWTLGESSNWYVPHEMLMLLLKKIGSERIVYGADYPYPSNLAAEQRLRSDIAAIKGWKLPKEDEENILGGTLEQLLSHS